MIVRLARCRLDWVIPQLHEPTVSAKGVGISRPETSPPTELKLLKERTQAGKEMAQLGLKPVNRKIYIMVERDGSIERLNRQAINRKILRKQASGQQDTGLGRGRKVPQSSEMEYILSALAALTDTRLASVKLICGACVTDVASKRK